MLHRAVFERSVLHLLAHAGHTAFYQGILRALGSGPFPTRD